MTARKRMSDAVVEALQGDFDRGGRAAIETVRRFDPVAYLRIVASLVGDGPEQNEDPVSDREAAELVAAILGS